MMCFLPCPWLSFIADSSVFKEVKSVDNSTEKTFYAGLYFPLWLFGVRIFAHQLQFSLCFRDHRVFSSESLSRCGRSVHLCLPHCSASGCQA